MALLIRRLAATKPRAVAARTADEARRAGANSMRMPGAAIVAPIVRRINGSVAGDVRAAIDAGWLVREPEAITKRALKAIDHETLWLALHLDTDKEASASVRALRTRYQQWATDARTLRRRVALIDQVIGPELDRTLERTCVSPFGRTRVDTERVVTTLSALRLALADHADYATVTSWRFDIMHERSDRRRSPRYAGRWRAAVLRWLLRVLSEHDEHGKRWTLRDLAALIVASKTDFTRAPCPAFVADADATIIYERIKKVLARNRKA